MRAAGRRRREARGEEAEEAAAVVLIREKVVGVVAEAILRNCKAEGREVSRLSREKRAGFSLGKRRSDI